MDFDEPLLLGVDVGTGSVRAALFTPSGKRVGYGETRIDERREPPAMYEQSSENIWSSVCSSTLAACSSSTEPNASSRVVAIGFDATCSLVAVDSQTFEPLSVSSPGSSTLQKDQSSWNIIEWRDHRAIEEATEINAMEDSCVKKVLVQFGGTISPESEPPKMMWLKRHCPQTIKHGIFFDLADWLVFRCVGDPSVRSACTVTCKWGWIREPGTREEIMEGASGWSREFWVSIDLAEVTDNNFEKLGKKILEQGTMAGKVRKEAAAELGLSQNCIIASPMIDAHCGAVGILGASGSDIADQISIEQRLAMACGTSTCHVAISRAPRFMPGIWGPFNSAIIPGYYDNEGGQSASGALLEYLVKTHPAYNGLSQRIGEGLVFEELARIGQECFRKNGIDPATHVHVQDSFSGNRSPFADPSIRGAISGLGMSYTEIDLATLYRAATQAICYGTRLIIERMKDSNQDIQVILACGGLSKSSFFLQELSDVCQLPVLVTAEPDATLLGGAILAASAAGIHGTLPKSGNISLPSRLQDTMAAMSKVGRTFLPTGTRKGYHEKKFFVYKEMYKHYNLYRNIMTE